MYASSLKGHSSNLHANQTIDHVVFICLLKFYNDQHNKQSKNCSNNCVPVNDVPINVLFFLGGFYSYGWFTK